MKSKFQKIVLPVSLLSVRFKFFSGFVMTIKKAVAKLKDDVAHLNLEVSLLINGIDRDILKHTGSSVEIEKF